MAKKKKVARTPSRKHVSRPKRDAWTIKRIFLPIGIAALTLLASSQIPYTQSFRSDILGDDDTQQEQQREEEKQQEEQARSSQNSGSGSQNSNTRQKETETETADGVKVKTKVEDNGAVKIEMESEDVHFKFEEENGEIKLRVKNAAGEEIRSRERLREMAELEQELEDEEIEISSDEGELEIEHNAIRARTNFPLSMDPVTRQLTVTTPAGTKTVAILPDAALVRLMASGFLSTIATGSALPSGATDSADLTQSLELKLHNGTLVYEAEGEKEHKLFGVFPVKTERTVAVSAVSGEVVAQTQSWLSAFIDLLSL